MARSAIDKVLDNAPESSPQVKTQTAIAKSNQAYDKAQKKTLENYSELLAEEKVEVTLAPMYQPYFGEIMTVGLNGLNIYVPVDGRSHKVPKSYAGIIHGRRRMVDDQISRRNRLSNVSANRESYAGELTLVPR